MALILLRRAARTTAEAAFIHGGLAGLWSRHLSS